MVSVFHCLVSFVILMVDTTIETRNERKECIYGELHVDDKIVLNCLRLFQNCLITSF